MIPSSGMISMIYTGVVNPPLLALFFLTLCREGHHGSGCGAEYPHGGGAAAVWRSIFAGHFRLPLEEVAVVLLQIIPHLTTRYVNMGSFPGRGSSGRAEEAERR